MKSTIFAAAVLAFFTSFVSAGIVIVPINGDQVVDKAPGDCFYGVVTPQGCGWVSDLDVRRNMDLRQIFKSTHLTISRLIRKLRKSLEQVQIDRAAAQLRGPTKK